MKCHDFLLKNCLSCDLLSLTYASAVKVKEDQLNSLFPEYLAVVKDVVVCTDGTEETRNKAKLAVSLRDGDIEFGFYENAIQFKKLENCPLHARPINESLTIIKNLLVAHNIIPYDLISKKGELKYVLITYSLSSNELLIRFVIRSKESLDRLKKMSINLIQMNPIISVVTANIQPIHQAILEGEEEIILTEKDYITHSFDHQFLFQGARSFFQTNSKMALHLYQAFEKELKRFKVSSLLDLYCGVGAFSFYAQRTCKRVVGIEISKEAIKYANLAKVKNECSHLDFFALDAEEFLNKNSEHFDAIVVNPPRRGLNQQIINQLIHLSPEYIFYSSCNVETLERDWQSLKNHYLITSLQIFDMFPYTHHFETLMILSKQKGRETK
jgi:23S rRNA (uracil747-C5)-methyltransferase